MPLLRKSPISPPPKSTKELLVEAASAEFNEAGYLGTDTNRIARRAGFAPQTFYRNFEDKLAIFLAIYERWRAAEMRAVSDAARDEQNPARRTLAAAKTLIAFHRDYAVFRRSLRILAIEEPLLRKARAASRVAQIEGLKRLAANRERSSASLLASILEIERLCDALADNETEDLGISSAAFVEEVARAVRRARGEE